MSKTYLVLAALSLVLSACATAEQQARYEEVQAKANTVRFAPAGQVSECTFLGQVNATEDLGLVGGQAAMEAGAKRKLQVWAAGRDANTVHISDRQLDKGRGGYDQTRLTLYGDLYQCGDQ